MFFAIFPESHKQSTAKDQEVVKAWLDMGVRFYIKNDVPFGDGGNVIIL